MRIAIKFLFMQCLTYYVSIDLEIYQSIQLILFKINIQVDQRDQVIELEGFLQLFKESSK